MGFVDLQVNGYGGIDFNSDRLTPESMRCACDALRRDGVESILATVITESLDTMCARISRIAQLAKQDKSIGEMIAGVHVEGPFIRAENGYVGAHPKDAVLPATIDACKRLLDSGRGMVRLMTLAPESDPAGRTIQYLVSKGVHVAAGHTNASIEQLKMAIDSGLSLFTHLGNGCPMQIGRHDNIIQRALSLRQHLTFTFIADGVHVPPFALRNYIDLAGIDRCIVVTDAIAPAGLGPGRYTLGRWDLNIGPDRVARSPDGSHLVGSAISMPMALANLEKQVGLTASQARQLVESNPRRILPSQHGINHAKH